MDLHTKKLEKQKVWKTGKLMSMFQLTSKITTNSTTVCLESPKNMAVKKSCKTFSIVLYRSKTFKTAFWSWIWLKRKEPYGDRILENYCYSPTHKWSDSFSSRDINSSLNLVLSNRLTSLCKEILYSSRYNYFFHFISRLSFSIINRPDSKLTDVCQYC